MRRPTPHNVLRVWCVAAMAALTLPVAASAGAAEPAYLHTTVDRCTLNAELPWYGENRERIQAMIDRYGRCGHRSRGATQVAVFDWDNTVVKNDVGDAMTFWLLRHDKVLQPPAQDWHRSSPFITSAAAAALRAACGTTVRAGAPLPTSRDTACADEILSVYSTGRTSSGDAAFAGYNRRRMEPTYAWAAQLLAGWTRQQVRGFTEAARRENLSAPIGTLQTVGTKQVTGWIRYYEQQRDLIRVLHRAGFDVWIASASPQPVVEVWASGVGVDPGHVIGIRSVTSRSRITYDLKGCGDVADGDNTMINYVDGKRCWINRVVFGVRGAVAHSAQPAHRRAHFAAGDSVTDVTFVRDAIGLRLVINRNRAELMCHAYANGDGRWLVNPMFIQPRPQQTTSYPCSTTAFTDANGNPGPVLDDRGRVIADQVDSVF